MITYETSTNSPLISDKIISTPKTSHSTQATSTQQPLSARSQIKRQLNPKGKQSLLLIITFNTYPSRVRNSLK